MGRADDLIQTLGLQPHPEGGHYVRSYQAALALTGLPQGPRPASTAIYFLLSGSHRTSLLHRLKSDELFHLYEGGPLEVLLLAPDGTGRIARLGLDLTAGERPQLAIPAGTWFGAQLASGVEHCLWGCTVAPGFDFADFQLAPRAALTAAFPSFAEQIARLTPGSG